MYYHVISGSSWGTQWAVMRNQTTTGAVLNLLSSPCLKSKPALAHSLWAKSRLCTALLLVPLAFQPAKGLVCPVSDPRTGVPNMWLNQLTPQGRSPLMYSPFSFEFPPSRTGPDLITSFPFLPDSMWIFLTVLVVQKSFGKFPAKFQWELFHM